MKTDQQVKYLLNPKLISENSEYENYAQTLAGQVCVNADVCLCNE